MRLIGGFLSVGLLLASRTYAALTYWADASCTNRPSSPYLRIVEDMISLAGKASRRLNMRDADPHFHYAFTIVMKVPYNNPVVHELPHNGRLGTSFELADYVLSTLASMTPFIGNDPTTANIRFYCDDDPMDATPNSAARWQLVPDRENDPSPNSQKTAGVDQEWFDQYNWIRRSTDSLGCKNNGGANGLITQMETYSDQILPEDLVGFEYNSRRPPADLAANRSTISVSPSRCKKVIKHSGTGFSNKRGETQLCEFVFDKKQFPLETFNDIAADQKLESMLLTEDYWELILSTILAHEACHVTTLELEDVADEDSYHWEGIMELDAGESITNADNIMWLMILAQLEDWKIRLDSDETKAKAGHLVRDTSIVALGRRAKKWKRKLSGDLPSLTKFPFKYRHSNYTL